MADINSTDTVSISEETIETIKQKLFDICGYLLALKHVINVENEQTGFHVALEVIVNRAGAVADSIIIKDLKTHGCVGNDNEWFACQR